MISARKRRRRRRRQADFREARKFELEKPPLTFKSGTGDGERRNCKTFDDSPFRRTSREIGEKSCSSLSSPFVKIGVEKIMEREREENFQR